jgi:hypothetical protein
MSEHDHGRAERAHQDPGAPAPDDGRSVRRTALLAGGVVAAAAVAGIALGVMLLSGRQPEAGVAPSASSSVSASATPDASAAPSEPAPTPVATAASTPAPAPAPASTDLVWTQTATFPAPGGLSMVDDVAQLGEQFVAVGVEFEAPLPNVGPTPLHHARAWKTADGSSWESIELGPEFANVRIGDLIVAGDGSLIAFGVRGIPDDSGYIDEVEPATWTTSDGLAWQEIEPPLDGFVGPVEQDAVGILAVVRASISTDVHELWFSSDGEIWQAVHSLQGDYVDVGAGDEGFAAVGWAGGEAGTPLTVASGDGLAWIDGPVPPFGRFIEVASLGGDWIVVDDPGGVAPTWFSANGLDWSAHGEIEFETVELPDAECREYRERLLSAGPWLVASTELTYPCSEGGFQVHGTQYLSVDGASWQAVPLSEGTVGENRSGSRVNNAQATGNGLILVGEEDGAATFWFGQAP